MKKKKIVIVGKPPLSQINPAIQTKQWSSCVWFLPIYEAFKNVDEYEIHWISITHDVKRRTDFEAGNQFFHVFPSYSLDWAQKFGYCMSKWVVMRELRRLKPDLVHAWGTEGYYGISAAGWKGKKILSMQGILSVCCHKAKMSDFSDRQSLLEVDTIRAYDLVTVESQWGIEHVRAMVPEADARLWEYAVQAPFFEAERELSDKPLFVTAGSDRPIKNMDAALHAFAAPELAHVKLVLAGGRPEKHDFIPPNAQFPGGLRRPEMLQLLRTAWGLIHPSFADTSPNIVKEARVLGIPVVVSSDCGGVQYVEDGKSGFIVDPNDIEGMTRAVSAIVSSRETAVSMGAYGREECRRQLSSETMIARLLEIYEEMLR